MKKPLIALALLRTVGAANAQISPIAHWDMNDSVNDITGNGHNGIASNITPAAGADGVMGHAYSFNGVNSMIYIPFSPDMNLTTGYSICAKVKVEGYNHGICHANTIFTHGFLSPIGTGTYALYFSDGAAGVDCGDDVDTTLQCFQGGACATGTGLTPPSITDFNYTPHITANTWYNVVVTFNDTVYKTFVNGVLMNTAIITTPGVPMGTFDTGASIGFDVFDSIGGYPYPFNGVIDDIMLYNYALSDSAATDYCTPVTTGISNTEKKEHAFEVYPNPATDMLTLQYAGGTTVTIYNVTGEKVSKTNVANNEQPIDISQLANGLYTARLISPDGSVATRKFVKQ